MWGTRFSLFSVYRALVVNSLLLASGIPESRALKSEVPFGTSCGMTYLSRQGFMTSGVGCRIRIFGFRVGKSRSEGLWSFGICRFGI